MAYCAVVVDTSPIYCTALHYGGGGGSLTSHQGGSPHNALSWWILSQSIACCVRRGPYTNRDFLEFW